MSLVVARLNDPHLVARVQEFFGVRLIGVVKDDQENSKNEKDGRVRTVTMLESKKCLYQINSLFFYYFFQFITHVGNEIFYIVFLPAVAWFYDERLGYLTTLSWSLVMYMGQAAKDVIKLPRPLTPPVVKMEDRYLLEYGFPSTHSMAILNISITFTVLIYRDMIQNQSFNNFQFGLVVLVAFLFTFFVCLSRVYLGMHSLLDITGGLLFSLTYSLVYLRFTDQIFAFITQGGFVAAMAQIALVVMACLNYPARERWSPARADTFLIMGVTVGISLALGLKSTLGLLSVGKIDYTHQVTLTRLVARFLLGIVPTVLVRFASKFLFTLYVRRVYYLPSSSSQTIKELIKSNFRLEIFYYLFCYGCVSFTCLGLSFLIFSLFGV